VSKGHKHIEIDENFFRGVDPHFIEYVDPFLKGLWDHYFRCELEGWENIPEGKALYVGNHNGMLTFEVLMVFYAWHKRFGQSRKALGLAHGIVLNNPLFRWLLPRLGAIPADPAVADEAMRRNFSLLVYPGGEKEAMRPYSERAKVEFFGRKGFIKLALRNKVPLVPIVSIGAHESYIIFHRGEEIAEALGLKKKYRLHGMPITARTLFFYWCLATGMLTFFPLLLLPFAGAAAAIPLPAKMQFRLLEPIDVCALYDESKSEEENLTEIYDLVVGRMQEVLTTEYAKRKLPILG
jgi:1-acyl-sn-glycerol-3-phosphate acyltransferase